MTYLPPVLVTMYLVKSQVVLCTCRRESLLVAEKPSNSRRGEFEYV